jgi:hypothetical protein
MGMSSVGKTANVPAAAAAAAALQLLQPPHAILLMHTMQLA